MRKHQYLIENNDLSVPGALILTLKPKSPKDIFNFKPGQYAMLSFYNQTRKLFINHPFSIASSPKQDGLLTFGIKILGKFTQNLQKLELGSQIEVLGPFGDFIFNPKKHQEAVFIAGGVGITPFISATDYASSLELNNKINLLYSVRTLKDALFYEEIKKLAAINHNFKPKLKITQETIGDNFTYCEAGYITKETIKENIETIAGKDFFICGPDQFMKVMENNLLELGVSTKRIHQEAFNVTPNLSFRKNFLNIFLVYGFSILFFLFFLNFIILVPKESLNKKALVDSINTTINSNRNSLISSKELLLNTINSSQNKTATPTTKQQSIVSPVVNTSVSVPISAPRTKVS